jgi:hypothetical protein
MILDTLRHGWPEQILTGRYAFRTRRRDGFAVGWRSQFEPDTYDVLDNRLGTVIGTVERTGGFVRPIRTVIYVRVDVSRSAERLDPRLVLACGIEEFSKLSTY